MKSITGAVALTTALLLAACGGADSGPDENGSEAPEAGSEATPSPVPLPPETQPLSADSVTAADSAAVPFDTTAS